jgi:beta-lactamase regulating signal transducer with metallopeptidase domain
MTMLLVNTIVFSLLFGAMLLVRKRLQKSISAVLQYCLWAVIVVKLILPFGFESPFRADLFTPPAAQNIFQTQPSDRSETMDLTEQPNPVIDTVPSAAPANQQYTTPLESNSAALTGSTDAQKPVDVLTIVFLLWAAGALAKGIRMRLSAGHIRRIAIHAQLEIPPKVIEIFNSCKRELGIQQHVEVLMQSTISVPAIMNVFHPLLILPAGIADEDDSRIRHICLHELIHLKYGDLIVLMLLNILSAVYWFNPLVWLCFKFIRRDMETACDHRVIGKIGKAERQQYIGTLLNYSKDTSGMPQAAGMADGRLNMERRIKGIYRKSKTTPKSRVITAILSAILLTVCVLTACQSGQTASDQETLAATATQQASAEQTPYTAPANWTDNSTNGKLTVNINANITYPSQYQYPVLQLAPTALTQAEIDKLTNYFAGGKNLYVWPAVMTKTDYQNAIIQAQQGDLANGEYVVTEESRHEAWALGQQMPSAPDTYQRQYTEDTLACFRDYNGKVFTDAGQNYLMVGVENGNNNDALILASSSTEEGTNFQYKGGWSYFTESQYKNLQPEDMANPDEIKKVLSGINFSKKDAQAKAQKVLDDLEIKDFELVNAEKAVLKSFENIYGLSSNQPDKGGYLFEYTKEYGGLSTVQWPKAYLPEITIRRIPFAPLGCQAMPSASAQIELPGVQATQTQTILYSQMGDREKIDILVTEHGVEFFSRTNQQTIVKTQNVQLLPFSQIKQNLKDLLNLEESGLATNQIIKNKTLTVDSATLEMAYTDGPDGLEQVVPAWVFDVAMQDIVTDGRIIKAGRSYVLNALDGSAINGSNAKQTTLFDLPANS